MPTHCGSSAGGRKVPSASVHGLMMDEETHGYKQQLKRRRSAAAAAENTSLSTQMRFHWKL